MPVRVGINGFGRIGRNIMRAALGDKNIDFVAVNDLTSAHTLAHLLKYDSVLGNLHATVQAREDSQSAVAQRPGPAPVEGPGRGRRL
jgi:glyceraldehyde 3-phosphate dehydrogenase